MNLPFRTRRCWIEALNCFELVRWCFSPERLSHHGKHAEEVCIEQGFPAL